MKIFRQFDGMCGPACLQSAIYELTGRKYTQFEIGRFMFPYLKNVKSWFSEYGCDPEDMVAISDKLNVKINYFFPSSLNLLKDSILDGKIPIVNFTAPFYRNGEHYSIFLGLSKERVLLGDPKIGKFREMDLTEFLKNWKENVEEFPRNRSAREREAIVVSRKFN